MHRTFLFVLLLSSLAFAQNPPSPRPSAKDYQASKTESQYSVGAKVLSKTQIQNTFATPLAGRYVVVEVGFYPADGKIIDLERSNFALVASDGKSSVTPATPEQIASILQKRPESSRDVTLYPSANVGYVTYPVYTGNGTKQVGGPVVGAGVGVGVGKTTSAATTDSDRKTMETELSDKQLTSGDVSKPVAGYLYFPVASKDKDKTGYQLEYRGADTTSTLTLAEK